MVFTKAYIFPALLGIWIPLTVLIVYTVAVLTNHVTPVLPYLSDAGSWAPESCIFGIMFTLGNLIWFTIIYLRFRQVEDLQSKYQLSSILNKLNNYSFYAGIISILGGLIVANFQVRQTFFVHLTGAAICFGFGTVCQALQAIISFKVYPHVGNRLLNISRVIVTLLSVITCTSTSVCAILSFSQYKGNDMNKWKPDDGGYTFHVISAVSEYILIATTTINLVSFAEEFKYIEIHKPIITNQVIDDK
ncbi:unnamed protein product [Phyllotreta striolata]|uniref:CWH43-like N-terminal domain-containing protein n=1 Tax=Phyllotreta striolata TaxID=444603 RepID=A0A9N9XNQ0_PHYSR|nr:unnamed protein product [Phyllotreta striolata]